MRGARLADEDRELDEQLLAIQDDEEFEEAILAEVDRRIAAAVDRIDADTRDRREAHRTAAAERTRRDLAELAAFASRIAATCDADEIDAAATVPYSGEA